MAALGVSPAPIRHGTLNGEEYKCSTVIQKANVQTRNTKSTASKAEIPGLEKAVEKLDIAREKW